MTWESGGKKERDPNCRTTSARPGRALENTARRGKPRGGKPGLLLKKGKTMETHSCVKKKTQSY